jgi:hypothetical protein
MLPKHNVTSEPVVAQDFGETGKSPLREGGCRAYHIEPHDYQELITVRTSFFRAPVPHAAKVRENWFSCSTSIVSF